MNEYEFFSNVDNWREIYKDCFEKNIITNAIVFESNVLRNKIVKELLDGSYVIGLPRIVDIQKDDGGTRRLLVLNDKDRVVFTMLYRFVQDKSFNLTHPYCVSYRPGLPIYKNVQVVYKAYRKYSYGYKIDLSKYFDTVPIDVIHKVIDKLFEHKGLNEVVKRFYDTNRVYDNSYVVHYYKSLGQGCSLSVLLANIVLYELDCEMEKLCNFYIRYSDDIVLMCETEEQLEHAYERLDSLSLKVNKNKTSRLNGMFKFLGYNISKDSIHVSNNKRERMKKLIKSSIRDIDKTKQKDAYIRDCLQSVYRAITSYGARYSMLQQWFLGCTDDEDLIWLQQQIKDNIRPLTHDFPCLGPPFIRFCQKEIRGHTYPDEFADFYFIAAMTVFLQGIGKIFCPVNIRTIFSPLLIQRVHITICTTGTDFFATMPRIPYIMHL